MSIEQVRIHLENAFDATIQERKRRLETARLTDSTYESELNAVLGSIEEAMEWLEPARATEPVDGAE